jgi:2-keto-3-deoxy-L-fuconate dehydrogenase
MGVRMFRLDKKRAVVTGAGSGIGRSVAQALAQQGASVVCLDIDPRAALETAELIRTTGGPAHPVQCDVSRDAEVNRAMSAAAAELGGIDILVNNAGVAHVGTVETTSEADFDRLFDVNVKGAFLCTRAVMPILLAGGGGVILSMASIAGLMGVPERFAYSATKGAILAMTYSIAVDYMKRNIRCNCICPARVRTPFVEGFVNKNYPGRQAEMMKTLSEYQPLGRMARPEEVAAMAVYLCSDEAAFITGQAFPLDGGVLVT